MGVAGVEPALGMSSQEGQWNPVYRRVLLKLSGESFGGDSEGPFNREKIKKKAAEIDQFRRKFPDVQIAIVVGAGNICRGVDTRKNDDRTTRDYQGMNATILNAQELMNHLEAKEQQVRLMSAIESQQLAENYRYRVARTHLDKGRIVILAGGTGHAYCTTDTAAVVRALELRCDIILMDKNGIEKVYDSDPVKNPDAKPYDTLTLSQVLDRGLRVMDKTAITLCLENDLPIQVFNMNSPNGLLKAMCAKSDGTMITVG